MSDLSEDSESPFSDNPYVLAAYAEVFAILFEFMAEADGTATLNPGYEAPLRAFIDKCDAESTEHAVVAIAGLAKCAEAFLKLSDDPESKWRVEERSLQAFLQHCRGYLPRVRDLGSTLSQARIDDPTAFSRFRAEAGPDLEGLKNAEQEKASRKGMPSHLALRIDRAIRVKDQDPKKKQ
jgi:hypothetical protein